MSALPKVEMVRAAAEMRVRTQLDYGLSPPLRGGDKLERPLFPTDTN
jgi:hypothetical protein